MTKTAKTYHTVYGQLTAKRKAKLEAQIKRSCAKYIKQGWTIKIV